MCIAYSHLDLRWLKSLCADVPTPPGAARSCTCLQAKDGEEGTGDAEAECEAQFTPVVELKDEVHVTTGEEDEDVLFEGCVCRTSPPLPSHLSRVNSPL